MNNGKPGSSSRGKASACGAVGIVLLVVAGAGSLASPISAQPFGQWAVFSPSQGGYIEVPHSSDFIFEDTLFKFSVTFEAWVLRSSSVDGCRSVVSKGGDLGWWVGLCGPRLRSRFGGSAQEPFEAGSVPLDRWTHIAAVARAEIVDLANDPLEVRHYIDGELVGSRTSLRWHPSVFTNEDPLRLGSDGELQAVPGLGMSEARVWENSRSREQIREWISRPIRSPQTRLIGVWPLDGSASAAVGGHHGTVVGGVSFEGFPTGDGCVPEGDDAMCLLDRFRLTGTWRAPDETTGAMRVVPVGTAESGLLWFFDPDNWEMLVKVLDGCSHNDRWWVFASGATDLFTRLEVRDLEAGEQRIYFNYEGEPALALTDTAAFTGCP